MMIEYKEKSPLSPHNSAPVIEIIFDGKVYGEWNEEANVDYPEDLTLSRDLKYLINVGVEIGKAMAQKPTINEKEK